MIGLGTIVNAVAVIVGGTVGSFIKNGLPERFKTTIIQAIGLSVAIIGISGTLSGITKVVPGDKLDRIMLMIFSLVIGGLIGELINIEDKLDKMGAWFQRKLVKGESNFAEGFVTASLIYCVGAMAIVGSLEDGLTGSTSTLFAKSILDGVSAVIFAATMGIGVAFSALPVFLYQGSITLLAGFIKPWLTDAVINQMSLVGSVLIMAIGINILEIKKIKVGNLLPSIFVPFVYYIIVKLLGNI
ncbi:MAG: DUF554 domain-containing protein [Clostridia bacterium]|nr:DUF554 domain-containing protein [Clostridia bacterium]